MKVRITRLNGQIGKLRQREQELGKELVFLGSIEVESTKLKEASAAFKEKVQTFNKPMKKKLVSLFIDRVEMYRSYNDPKKPDIHVEVIFRFNPEKLSQLGDVVSTEKQPSERPREIQKGVSEGSSSAQKPMYYVLEWEEKLQQQRGWNTRRTHYSATHKINF